MKKIAPWTGKPIVQTRYGSVKGYGDECNTFVWKAVPYAKPPVGALRWKAPRDPEPWEGIRAEKSFSGKACQYLLEKGAIIGSEDCLYLNIWRPQTEEKDLPVYFWIHGGGNVFQFPFLEFTPGSRIASQSNMVFISVQFRLGEFGWLTHPALRSGKNGDEYDDSGNYGTLDIIKALTWVRDNITGFGGNPNNVFVCGESGGAWNTMTLLLSPAAKGLFHKAMAQTCANITYPIAQGDANTNAIITHLLVNDGTVSDMAKAEAYRDKMTHKQIAAYLRLKSFDEILECRKDVGFNAIFNDGAVIHSKGFDSIDDGSYPNKVPVIIGTNKEEPKMALYTMNAFPDNDELYEGMSAIGSNMVKATCCDNLLKRLRANIEQPNVYGYHFLWGGRGLSGKSPLKGNYGLKVGACHAMDIAFFFNIENIFPNLDNSLIFTEENRKGREALTNAMMKYIAQFVRTGNPNKRGDGLPEWKPWASAVGLDKCLMFNVNGDDIDIKMSKEELTFKGVIKSVDAYPEPLRTKIKAGIAEMKMGRHKAFWAAF